MQTHVRDGSMVYRPAGSKAGQSARYALVKGGTPA